MFKIKLSKLLYVDVIVISVLLLTPLFIRNAIVAFYIVSIMTFFNILLMQKRIKQVLKNSRLLNIIIIWIMILLFYRVIFYSKTSFGNMFNYFKFYFLVIVGLFFLKGCDYRKKTKAFKIIWIIIIFNIISNIIQLSKNKNANTLIMIKDNQFLETNIGSVGFISAIFIFSLIMLVIFFIVDDRKYKAFSIMSYILAFYLIVFRYNRATTSLLIVLFSSLLLILYLIKKVRNKQKIIFGAILFLASILFAFFLVSFLSKHFEIDRLIVRLEWIKNLIFGNLSIGIIGENSLSTRIYLIIGTIQTWLSSPKSFLFGVGDNLRSTDSIDEMFQLTGVGYHSDLVDILGTNGLLGALFFYGILYQIYKIIAKNYQEKYINYVKIVFLGFLTCILMNHTLGGELGVVIFFMLPYINLLERSYK